jgi:hypothetical protein
MLKLQQRLDGSSSLHSTFGLRQLALTTVPSILNEIAAEGPEAMRELARLTRAVVFAGAPLSLEVGDLLAAHGANIIVCFGS